MVLVSSPTRALESSMHTQMYEMEWWLFNKGGFIPFKLPLFLAFCFYFPFNKHNTHYYISKHAYITIKLKLINPNQNKTQQLISLRVKLHERGLRWSDVPRLSITRTLEKRNWVWRECVMSWGCQYNLTRRSLWVFLSFFKINKVN